MKTNAEKQASKDTRNERRREARATIKVEAEALELMVDVSTLTPGDIFILNERKFIVLSIDSQANHIHTNLLEAGQREPPGAHGQVDFGTMVTLIGNEEANEAAED